jgi:GNAT superfamily N-acetyltransferase
LSIIFKKSIIWQDLKSKSSDRCPDFRQSKNLACIQLFKHIKDVQMPSNPRLRNDKAKTLSSAIVPPDKNQSLQFGLTTTKDASAMVDFLNRYNYTHKTPQQWLWEWQTFAPDKSVMAVVRCNHQLIATLGVIPLFTNLSGKYVWAGKTEGLLIIPDRRGRGIATRLYKYVENQCIRRDFRFIWGFTHEREAIITFRMLGFTVAPKLADATRYANIRIEIAARLKMKTALWMRLGSIARLIATTIFDWKHWFIPKLPRNPRYEVRQKLPINSVDLKDFYTRLQKRYERMISISLDSEYLKWRVREHPFLKYDEYQVYQDGHMRAYALVTLFNGKLSISDLTSEDDYATYLLLVTIIEGYQRQVGRFTLFFNPKDVLAQSTIIQLRKLGFSIRPNVLELLYKDLQKDKGGQEFDIKNWHISGLWTEGYEM